MVTGDKNQLHVFVFPVQEATQGDSLRTSRKPSSSIALWDGDCLPPLLLCALPWTPQELCILDMVCT